MRPFGRYRRSTVEPTRDGARAALCLRLTLEPPGGLSDHQHRRSSVAHGPDDGRITPQLHRASVLRLQLLGGLAEASDQKIEVERFRVGEHDALNPAFF